MTVSCVSPVHDVACLNVQTAREPAALASCQICSVLRSFVFIYYLGFCKASDAFDEERSHFVLERSFTFAVGSVLWVCNLPIRKGVSAEAFQEVGARVCWPNPKPTRNQYLCQP